MLRLLPPFAVVHNTVNVGHKYSQDLAFNPFRLNMPKRTAGPFGNSVVNFLKNLSNNFAYR